MKLSDNDYEKIKEWYCQYQGIEDESLYWNKSIIIGDKLTHSDIMEVLEDFFESDFIAQIAGNKLDLLEEIQGLTEQLLHKDTGICTWKWDKIRKDYNTDCGACFDFPDRTANLKYTDIKYCPFCGNIIKEQL